MPDYLLIRPRDRAAAQWRWRTLDAAGDPVSGEGALAEAAALAGHRRVILIVPGESVLLTRARVPVRSRARALAAVPWALEDRLVADVEALHFALGGQDADGDWEVAVVDHESLAAWLAACAGAGVPPHAALPEPLALPEPAADAWHALEEPGRVICRTGPATGFACAPALLPTITAGLEAPAAVERERVAGVEVPWPERIEAVLGRAREIEDPLRAFALTAPRLDLLQGRYSRRERAGRLWRRWRTPAALAAVLLLLVLADAVLDYRQLGAREQALRAATEEILRKAVPDVGRVVNPRVQLANRLEAAKGAGSQDTDGLLEVLARAGPVLRERGEVTLLGLDWRGDTLDLSVETGELAALDRLQRGLQARGFAVELRGVERDEERVRGEVRVTEGTA